MQSAKTCLLPQLYEELMGDLRATLMDRWRRPRAYPRVIRIKMKDFKLKRPHHRQKLLEFEEFIRKAVG